jgi:gliding motility-associated lipoprotein GldH|tara:strand:- start:25397 stop:25882 length:486 start_codon:yes stop_codon:yes gene_type:complete
MRSRYLVIILFIGFVSCDSKSVFDEYKSFDNSIWLRDDMLEFQVEVEDTISKNNLFLNLRNNRDYEFSNLFIIAQINFPDGFRVIDTLEYEMTDKEGRFLGVGYTDIKQNKLFYKENVRFNQKGQYSIKVEQAMRKIGNIQALDSLRGVTDLGFRIESITP